jgi:hypothetical protein
LIFGQDNPPPRPDITHTAPLGAEPSTTDRPTATIEQTTVDLKNDKHKQDKSET